jgi:hypothetical protein
MSTDNLEHKGAILISVEHLLDELNYQVAINNTFATICSKLLLGDEQTRKQGRSDLYAFLEKREAEGKTRYAAREAASAQLQALHDAETPSPGLH